MSDRLFGLILLAAAVGYIASAAVIQTSFLQDPVGPRVFPYIVGGVGVLCSLTMIIRPDPEPTWPGIKVFAKLAFAVLVLIGYAYALRPMGFIIPTAVAAGLISYQISPRVMPSIYTGLGLSVGLFFVFKYALGLGLFAFPELAIFAEAEG